jgi:hypothetical protein
MKSRRAIMVISALLVSGGMAGAAHVWDDPSDWWSGHLSYDVGPKYTAEEFSLDLFASYINPEGKLTDLFDTNIRHGFWGAGAGANYFFTRELGIGVDVNISDKPDDLRLVDEVTGNLLLRLPLGESGLAPYLIGSGGRGISPRYEWVYGGGVGLEYRFNPTTGIFSDARFLWAEKSTADDRLLIRAGLRIVF